MLKHLLPDCHSFAHSGTDAALPPGQSALGADSLGLLDFLGGALVAALSIEEGVDRINRDCLCALVPVEYARCAKDGRNQWLLLGM